MRSAPTRPNGAGGFQHLLRMLFRPLLSALLPLLLLLLPLPFPLPYAHAAEAERRPAPEGPVPSTPRLALDSLVLEPGPDSPLWGRVRVIYAPGAEPRARRTLSVLERHSALPGLPEDVPVWAEILLAADAQVWEQATGGRAPHWGAAVAIPALEQIVIPTFRNPWTGGMDEDRTLRHEWAHLGLHGYLRGLRIPRWFDEGYAQWASGGWDQTSGWKLRLALARRDAPSLSDLELSWPDPRSEAEVAYLLAASAVAFMVEDSGARGMKVFLDRWRETEDFEEAFRRTFGMTTGTFETRWVRHVKSRYGWLLVFVQTSAAWTLLAILLLLLRAERRRRDLERLARLRARDPGEDGTWWTPSLPP